MPVSPAIHPSAPPADAPPAAALLAWYDRHRRVMPWRAVEGETASPYHVWLSEIMLQQTSVAAVIPYFQRFLTLFPTVEALASAPEERVLQAWAGLGYYARARNLHACASAVVRLGSFPQDAAGLRRLPGIGAYTAAAIAAIAFGEPLVPVDGNVERVAARLFAIATPVPAGKRAIASAAMRLNRDPPAQARASDFAQALFDLGATLCTPRNPACAICPWTRCCAARAQGIAPLLPARSPKKSRPQRFGVIFILSDRNRQVLLQRRPGSGLLGGMTGMPGLDWRAQPWDEAGVPALAPMVAAWRHLGTVEHVFTHFALAMDVYAASVAEIPRTLLEDGFLRPLAALDDEALPSLMRKCVGLLGGQ